MTDVQMLYKLVDIPGKGQGLVATKKLQPGTIIVTEKPLIVVDTVTAARDVLPMFQSLPGDKKIAVLALYDPGEKLNKKPNFLTEDEQKRKVLRIFEANSIDLCSHSEFNINKSGLYQTISKFNHSCSPNVVWTWVKGDSNKSIKQVRVCREIQAEEEIVASYCLGNDQFPTRQDRRTAFRNWFFTCTCQVCGLTGEELKKNDDARLEIKKLHDLIVVQASSGGVAQALESAKKKLKIMKTIKKEMILEIPAALLECCELAAHLHIPPDKTAEMKKKAEEMSTQFGDVHLYNYNKKCKKIARI
eukprot:GFUD01001809.1.p1 GENE.GFUD01001809.1~~GFUD01001809.1.p1  ORF type:complete len:328 (+),score=123.53 GFUD01001809.1:77-985(+)